MKISENEQEKQIIKQQNNYKILLYNYLSIHRYILNLPKTTYCTIQNQQIKI
jgi:hypothetical protein